MAHYARLWQESNGMSDFRLDVVAADATPDTDPLYTLNLHGLVLGTASPGHFRGHCIRRKENDIHVAPKASGAKRQRDAAEADPGHVQVHIHIQTAAPLYSYRLSIFTSEPEVVPRAVLCHLYTGALPDDPDQLIWMLRRADYLDLKRTVYAVLHKLISVGSKQLTLQHAALLHSLPAFQCDARQGEAADQPAAKPVPAEPAGQAADTTAPAATTPASAIAPAAAPAAAAVPAPAPAKTVSAQLQELTDSLLLAHLPSAPAIVTDAALLAQFTQLPLALVKRWVELDKYEVDSGNTLAVLFTAWHDAQPEPPSEEQCKQLSALLPLTDVSFGFHSQALQHCKWWHGRSTYVDSVMAHYLAIQVEGMQADWQKSASERPITSRATQRNTHTWTVTAEQLRQLWHDKSLPLPHFYFSGYMLGAKLQLKHDKEDTAGTGPLFLSLAMASQWPTCLAVAKRMEPAEALISTFTYSLPAGADAQFSESRKALAWRNGYGWYPLTKGVQYASLAALVPNPSSTLSVVCEASYKA